MGWHVNDAVSLTLLPTNKNTGPAPCCSCAEESIGGLSGNSVSVSPIDVLQPDPGLQCRSLPNAPCSYNCANNWTARIRPREAPRNAYYTRDIESNQEGEGEGDDANEEMGRGSVGGAPVAGWQQRRRRQPSRHFFSPGVRDGTMGVGEERAWDAERRSLSTDSPQPAPT
jgi:hypothetical protein